MKIDKVFCMFTNGAGRRAAGREDKSAPRICVSPYEDKVLLPL